MIDGEFLWATRNYGTEGQHSAPDQKWEVTVSGGRTVAINFALFANKHLLKPSSDPNVTQEQKAAKLRLKRARAPEVAKVHHKQKYGDVAHTNTAIDLSKIDLKTVVEKFAQALVAAQAAAGRWKPGDKKSVTVDLGTPRCIILATARRTAVENASKVTVTAAKGDTSSDGKRFSFTVFHLDAGT